MACQSVLKELTGRGGQTRTDNPSLPKRVRYQLRHTPTKYVKETLNMFFSVLTFRTISSDFYRTNPLRNWPCQSVYAFGFFGQSSLNGEARRSSAGAKTGVSSGDRTHDPQNHNLMLYRLSYAHHYLF